MLYERNASTVIAGTHPDFKGKLQNKSKFYYNINILIVTSSQTRTYIQNEINKIYLGIVEL